MNRVHLNFSSLLRIFDTSEGFVFLVLCFRFFSFSFLGRGRERGLYFFGWKVDADEISVTFSAITKNLTRFSVKLSDFWFYRIMKPSLQTC